MFMALPTGYGKSWCHLPGASSERLERIEETSIVGTVSPLVALMKDKVHLYSSKGASATYINWERLQTARGVTEGRYQLVYFSPHAVSQKWKETLTGEP